MRTQCMLVGLALFTVGCITEDGRLAGEDVQSSTGAISDGDVVIKAVHSGKCLDVAGASTANGASVQQWECNGTNAQVFHLASLGNGYYQISNPNARKSLDVRGVSRSPGARIQIWDYVGGTNQQFAIEPLTNGEFGLRARHTGLPLGVAGSSQSNGAALEQAAASGGEGQRFRIEPVGGGSAGTGTQRCKRGVAYGGHSQADMEALRAGVSWWYNWSPAPDPGVAGVYEGLGVEFVPMVWGDRFASEDPARRVPSGAEFLLGFNEPNFFSQANLTAQQAARLWPQMEQIAADKGLALVSPAVNFCGGGCNQTDPFEYLEEFFAACSGCKVDYVAAHWYACSKDALTWYLGELKRFGKPIWLTEFACLDAADTSPAVQEAYMEQALQVLEDDPAVFRYAWFAGRFDPNPNVNLLGASGQLTRLGQTYVSYPQRCEE
ncbi:uncharacterized protein SOCE26_057880 [Sorangium cellulosum]|uniref:Ricin B lectin domain-containing protein n=1 Tax=Sorangium cellulosum TaxID=56 RepID=A0A2L0EYD2_SORCE|nr:glycosyl hydrolase [Sorangium cellulosum]AUX44324.1 uncharacterized protein SOCE26_057880 [Sorangium cellulosum]